MSQRNLFILSLQNLDLVAIGVSDKSHFAFAIGKFFSPLGWPDFYAGFFKPIAIRDDVIYTEAGMHEVFWTSGGIIRRPGKLQKNIATFEFHESELVSLRRVFSFSKPIAQFLIESDGGV
jgi:hypothetical protein